MKKKKKPKSERMGTVKIIAVSRLHPNSWNPNKQTEFMFEKELGSIKKFGFIDPITVREKPGKPGHYEILDGEHRYKAGIELGYKALPCTNLGRISDAKAKAVTDIMNNLRGDEDAKLKSQMVRSILEEDEKLASLLPYDEGELRTIVEASDPATVVKTDKEERDGSSGWVGLKVSLSPEQHKVVSSAMSTSKTKNNTKSDAEALTAICRRFMSRGR